ncbi:hypothetical protein [Ralstonia phage RP13]|nr:hypothetical protein [Ralstonia phage RP13]
MKDTISLKDIEDLYKSLSEHPIAKFMREKGFDPDNGCKLIIPHTLAMKIGNLPDYVIPSIFATDPILVNPNVTPKVKIAPDNYMWFPIKNPIAAINTHVC